MKTALLSIIENAFVGTKPHEATFTLLTLEDGSTAPLGRIERVAVPSIAAAHEWAAVNAVRIVENNTQQRTSKEDFIQKGRDAVLAAIDAYAVQATACDSAKGWRDRDLSNLIPALDAHFAALATRLADPESTEPGSANIVFTE